MTAATLDIVDALFAYVCDIWEHFTVTPGELRASCESLCGCEAGEDQKCGGHARVVFHACDVLWRDVLEYARSSHVDAYPTLNVLDRIAHQAIQARGVRVVLTDASMRPLAETEELTRTEMDSAIQLLDPHITLALQLDTALLLKRCWEYTVYARDAMPELPRATRTRTVNLPWLLKTAAAKGQPASQAASDVVGAIKCRRRRTLAWFVPEADPAGM
jgi:hypothetical protein